VRESFDEYKKTIESNLLNFPYLYDGDVISSTKHNLSKIFNTKNTSPSFIIDCISKIYDLSVEKMMSRSININLDFSINKLLSKSECFQHISNSIKSIESKFKFKTKYVFTSRVGLKLFPLTGILKNKSPFPSHMYVEKRYNSYNYDLYYSPIIDDSDENNISIYLTDSSIQGLVYSIQNMDYLVEKLDDDSYKHTIYFNLYDCKYHSYKVSVRDISKLRDDKINIILNGN
jgi:hypothetical protein